MLAVSAAAALALVSCFEPSYPACAVRCAADGACPSGQSCREDRFCHGEPGAPLCGPCLPRSCDEVPGSCGALADGCGGVLACGDCEPPETCGGGGPSLCGVGDCEPSDPCGAGVCGEVSDECGNAVDCGGCPPPEACGAEQPNRCGEPACTPSCPPGELACGDDGCGGTCGGCPDDRWSCHDSGYCCIRNGQQCQPFTEGCNCCPGLFCLSGFCTPASGCALAPARAIPPWEREAMAREAAR
jgi:hypothetical protein